jgi:sulfur carrier protein ThiS
MKIKLGKPFTVGDKSLEELDLKLEDLTGADIEQCVRDAQQTKGETVRVLVTDMDLHVQIAAKASGVSVNDLRRLKAPDFVEVVTAVQGFLTGSV